MAQPLGTAAALRRPVSAHIMDYAIPAAILLAVLVVLAPVPAAVVDVLLAVNLTISVVALLGALAARTPLDMSIFPTFLLGITLVRLVLNIATTRLILSRAAIDGSAAAGEVVESFGEFIAANNLVVGGVIFAIIAIVQFIVITAGSTRTSEVAARFALDGLPGRQMAIDTEVNAGTLTREQARGMRLDLQRQADFFASMDGASRFVRGEAVASVIITAVNIVGGLAIGVIEHGMAVDKALGVYARLTIGDGLSSAVPALFISVATGLLVSRSSQAVDLSREFGRQFTAKPHVLAITGVFLAILSLSGLPFLPLAGMAAVTLTAAVMLGRRPLVADGTADTGADDAGQPPRGKPVPRASSPADELLADDRVAVELGRGLVGLVAKDGQLLERVATLRGTIAADLGVVLPQVAFRDDLALPGRGYRIMIAGDVVIEDEIPAGRMLAILPPGESSPIEGDAAIDPLTGRTATWVSHAQADTCRRRGAAVYDDAGSIVRAVEAAVRRRADRLLTRDAANRLVESLRAAQPAVVEQIVPGVLTVARIQRTLQCLLREGVPIRPLAELLEIMSDHAAEAAEPWQLAEIVRRRLAGTICRRARDPQGRLTAVRLAGGVVDSPCGSRGVPQAVAGSRRPRGRGDCRRGPTRGVCDRGRRGDGSRGVSGVTEMKKQRPAVVSPGHFGETAEGAGAPRS
ncbi:MAG: flagellar biosynthesis protein FlhA [Planctomycetia bacterium]|nr:flagellar biosynthesis protein FlhA [Planctomycetia bacterium]